jgi:beta-lactamase regulating signal transducer with metallopeptidase domain/Tol biopolymer transport system component
MSAQAFNELSASLTALAAAVLWQSALVTVIVAGASWLLRRSTPVIRYWCWQIVALKLLVVPWWVLALPFPSFLGEATTDVTPPADKIAGTQDGMFAGAMDAPAPRAAGEIKLAASATLDWFGRIGQLTWRSWLVLGWSAGIACQLGYMLIQRRRLGRLLTRAAVAADPALLAMVEQVAARLGLRQPPAVAITDEEGAPFVCGLWRPLLVLPRGLMADLGQSHWREVVLHELAHIKRRDLWWGWLPALARTIHFFNPVAHWTYFRVRLERELACDQLAMLLSGRCAADYAEVLVHVVSYASMPALLTMGSLEGLSTFWKRRLTMLLPTSRSAPRLSRLARLALVSAGLVVCLVPTFQDAPAQGQPQQARADARGQGRIYVSASLRFKPEGQDEEKNHNMIMAIDPATGKWQKITERGHALRVSPDGKTVVFSNSDDGIWNCDTGGSNNPGKISDKSGRPVWSGDGKYLVATKQELIEKETDKKPRTSPAWKDETWRFDADGRNPIKLPIPDTDSVEDWSPDGQWFLTCSDRHAPFGSGYQLYLMKTDGTAQRRLTQGGLNVYSRFSPDGKRILFLRQTAKAGNSIWTMDFDGKNAKEVLKEEGLASPNGAFWSPDGKQIAVSLFNWQLDENGRKVGPVGTDANPRIEIMNADGTNRRELKLQGGTFVFIGSLGDWR